MDRIMDASQPDFNRIVAAVNHREADRVPLIEVLVDFSIQSRFLGKKVKAEDLKSQVEFWAKAGYDYIPLTVGMMTPGKVTKDSHISKVIGRYLMDDPEKSKETEDWNLEKKAWIRDERDFERFPWEEAGKLDISPFYEVQGILPQGMKIIAVSGKIFTLTWLLMGFENFFIQLMEKPAFVTAVFEKVANIQYAAVERIQDIPNVKAIWAVDDIAFKSGAMTDPAVFRKFVFPWYKEMARRCHNAGLFFFYHSDGILWDFMPDLIDIGIDALHPIDPTCMDINDVKRKVGDKICLLGNISNEILLNGSPEDVANLTMQRLRDIAPGGGYALGSGNSVPEWAKFENYMAMRETALKYGGYPINPKEMTS